MEKLTVHRKIGEEPSPMSLHWTFASNLKYLKLLDTGKGTDHG